MRLFLALVALPGFYAASSCNLTGVWQSVGSSDPVTVLEGPTGAFTATAQSGFTNAAGFAYANGTLYLDCCGPKGIYGAIDTACALITWSDGVGSQWARPRPPTPRNATISNLVARVDDTGALMRLQDGCLADFNGMFYLYGARYQCCPVSEQPACYQACGWRNTTFAVYSSPDLQVWHLENDNLMPIFTDPASPHSNTRNAYFEPCVLYSASADHCAWARLLTLNPPPPLTRPLTPPPPHTHTLSLLRADALWFLNTNTKAVAVSDSPTGPFESVTWDTGLAQGSDSYFWFDKPSGVHYVKHNGPPPAGEKRGAHYVARLAPDLLSVVFNASSPAMLVPALPVPPSYQGAWPSCSEGGGMFEHGGRFYVMAGACCCFCHAGANAYVWMSSTGPLGEYVLQDDIGVIPFNVSTQQYLTGAQQFSVAQLPTATGSLPMYIGQRFGSAPDGLKCHDLQYWAPLTVAPATGQVAEMAWVDEFSVQLLL